MPVGTVVQIDASFYHVENEEGVFRCVLRGTLKKKARGVVRPVAVGDRVEFTVAAEDLGAIEKVLERRTKLSRPSARSAQLEQVIVANVDQIVVVASIKDPPLVLGIVDRFLVAAEKELITPVVCINKIDLAEPEDYEWIWDVYKPVGYEVVFTSATTGEGVPELRERLKGRISVFAGHSGVGKSSLLNAIQPGLRLKTEPISKATRKGRHVTTSVALLKLNFGGYVVDTPGIRELGLWGIEKEEVGRYFPEIRAHAKGCVYQNCQHVKEPGCAVREAVARGEISESRWKSYLSILDSFDHPERRGARGKNSPSRSSPRPA